MGDGDIEEWIGSYESDEEFTLDHTWDEQGEYTIKAKVRDVHGVESDWAAYVVTMPKNKAFNFHFILIERLFERFPNAFPLFRQLLGL